MRTRLAGCSQGDPPSRPALRVDGLRGELRTKLYDLLLRREIETLFSDEHNITDDIFRYAEHRAELGQPGFAAMLYWNAKRSIEPDGVRRTQPDGGCRSTAWKTGNQRSEGKVSPAITAAEFKRIDAERAKRKKESPATAQSSDQEKLT